MCHERTHHKLRWFLCARNGDYQTDCNTLRGTAKWVYGKIYVIFFSVSLSFINSPVDATIFLCAIMCWCFRMRIRFHFSYIFLPRQRSFDFCFYKSEFAKIDRMITKCFGSVQHHLCNKWHLKNLLSMITFQWCMRRRFIKKKKNQHKNVMHAVDVCSSHI